MNKLKQKNQKGFTLIELLVVIAIIGLLASVVLLALNSARQKSRDAKRLADVRQIASALELFYDSATPNGYPASMASLTASGLLGSIPVAPTPIDGSCATATAGSNAYTYAASGTAVTNIYPDYRLTFCLGASTGGLGPNGHVLSPAGIQ